MSLTLHSPAKINLFLKIVNRRSDAYHNLASLFQTIDLCDIIHISLSQKDQLSCSDPSLPTDDSNLVMKAVNLFRRKTGRNFFVNVHLEKQIPQQAGLGGGSSNAATTLWALNQMHGNLVSSSQLAIWSSEIGSDIPFFFSQGTAFCTGKGENVENLSPFTHKDPLWIVKPSHGLSTPLVYKNLDLSKSTSYLVEIDVKKFIEGNITCFNDLELSAFSLLPSLAQLKERLMDSGFHTVVMSGSGSAFFCFGSGQPPKEQEFYVKQVNLLNRESEFWYNPLTEC